MDYVKVLGDIANAARLKVIELMESGQTLAEKVSRGAYGHQSSRLDVEVEGEIIRFIEENDLPLNIFTEEAGYVDRGYEKNLIVDPIDGSYNAEHGIPFYSVSLAVAGDTLGSVEAAFVKNIPLNVDYWAIRGGGAYRNGKKLKVSDKRTNLYVVYLGRNASDSSYRIAKKARRVRDLGCASLEMITVAEGIADIYYYSFKKSGAVRIVDIAASTLIVRESGGLVLDEDLKPLEMKMSFDERRNVVALSSEDLKEVFS